MDLAGLQDKAKILLEMLPYFQSFFGKTIIVKYGGSAMSDSILKESIVKDIALLKQVGLKPIVVVGGGKEIDSWLSRLNIERRFKDGLRVTDKDTMEVAEMVLNKVSKEIVALFGKYGISAVGLSGKDSMMLEVKPRDKENLGYVGDITKVRSRILESLLQNDFVPVVCPIGINDNESYNINADLLACALAEEMKVEKLVFLSDIDGVYEDYEDKDSLIPELHISHALKLIESGKIHGGMIPKINACIHAINNGVSRVHIIDGRIEHCLLLEFFTKRGIGTAILR